MYRTTLIFLLSIAALSARARDGFSLSASYGMGWGFQRKSYEYNQYSNYNKWTFSPGLSKRVDILVQYQSQHFIIQSGLAYMVSSYVRSVPDDNHFYTSSSSNPHLPPYCLATIDGLLQPYRPSFHL